MTDPGFAIMAEGPVERPDIRLSSGAVARHYPMCNGATQVVFAGADGSHAEWIEYCELMRLAYFTLLVPWSDTPTAWHPTDRVGPFSVLTRGAFQTAREASAWADAHLAGQPYTIRVSVFEPDVVAATRDHVPEQSSVTTSPTSTETDEGVTHAQHRTR